MGRGCLSLIGVFVAVLAAEWWAVGALGLPHVGLVATVLALTATLALGSLQGIAQAWRQRETPRADPAQWHDGAVIRVEGTLQPVAEVPTAPFSERPAVYLYYGAVAVEAAGDVQLAQRPHWRGLVRAPAMLHTAAGSIALQGMPPVRFWPEQQFSGEPVRRRAALHLAATAWRRAADTASPAHIDSLVEWAGQAQDSEARMHVMNAQAEHALGLGGGPADAEALRQRLGARAWTFVERVVPPGSQVTVIGTYRAQPRRIEVGLSPRHPEHAVHLGAAAALAARHWRSTLIFALALAALAVVAHGFVYGNGGVHLRALLDAIGAPG